MTVKSLDYRTAEKFVQNYNDESTALLAAHHDAMECRDCEAFLQLGIEAFEWIIRADRVIRMAVFGGKIQFDPQIEQGLQALCRQWLAPCTDAEKWIALQEQRGYEIDNVDKFRECCQQMRAIVEAQNQVGDEPLPAAMAALRDQAIHEHSRGETAEFIQGEE